MAVLNADPCVAVEELKSIIQNIITGGQALVVEFWTEGGTRRRVEYGRANVQEMRIELAKLVEACKAKQGKPPSRRAFIGG